MAYTYEEIESQLGGSCIRATDGNLVLLIPKEAANSDYQAYLRWLENPEAEQSTPSLAVDEA